MTATAIGHLHALIRLPDGHLEAVPFDRLPAGVDLELIPPGEWERIRDDVEAVVANATAGTHPTVSHAVAVQAHYLRCLANGCAPALAELLALRTFPGIKSDAIYNEGRVNGNQFAKTPWLGDYYRGLAEAAGVSVTGKHYCSGLADFPGDPTAWVADRHDVLKVAQAKGYKVTGYVEYTPPEAEPLADVAIAPELVEAEVARRLAADPDRTRDDVYDDAYRLRAGLVDPNPLLVGDPIEEDPE